MRDRGARGGGTNLGRKLTGSPSVAAGGCAGIEGFRFRVSGEHNKASSDFSSIATIQASTRS